MVKSETSGSLQDAYLAISMCHYLIQYQSIRLEIHVQYISSVRSMYENSQLLRLVFLIKVFNFNWVSWPKYVDVVFILVFELILKLYGTH